SKAHSLLTATCLRRSVGEGRRIGPASVATPHSRRRESRSGASTAGASAHPGSTPPRPQAAPINSTCRCIAACRIVSRVANARQADSIAVGILAACALSLDKELGKLPEKRVPGRRSGDVSCKRGQRAQWPFFFWGTLRCHVHGDRAGGGEDRARPAARSGMPEARSRRRRGGWEVLREERVPHRHGHHATWIYGRRVGNNTTRHQSPGTTRLRKPGKVVSQVR